jgi:hypothetical protein
MAHGALVHHAFYVDARERAGREVTPSAAIIDRGTKWPKRGSALGIKSVMYRVEPSKDYV